MKIGQFTGEVFSFGDEDESSEYSFTGISTKEELEQLVQDITSGPNSLKITSGTIIPIKVNTIITSEELEALD